MNSLQFKTYCKIVGTSIMLLFCFMACVACSSKETTERNRTLEIERLSIEGQIKEGKKQLYNLANKRNLLFEDIKVAQIIKEDNTPEYILTLKINHISKNRHNTLMEIKVSKEQYQSITLNNAFKLYGKNPNAFEVIVIKKLIKAK